MKEEMNSIVNDEISIYEDEIQNVSSAFDVAHELIDDFQNSYLDVKQESDKINVALRENFAKNNSLRRKDFNNMVKDILSIQEEQEKEIRDLLKVYLNEQKELMHSLIENLGKFKNACIKQESTEIKELHILISQIILKQEKRKDEVTSKLKEFQKEQQNVAQKFKELLAKGNDLRIKEFKSMLKVFKNQREERIVLKRERKDEVAKMLSNFKRDRQRNISFIKNINNNLR